VHNHLVKLRPRFKTYVQTGTADYYHKTAYQPIVIPKSEAVMARLKEIAEKVFSWH
jgi:hypothetical protein